jgi:glycosyltransferase involved in cell wall biosynthesis
MSMPRISAAMIVRDGEAVLEDCLRSIRDQVDEIVITDTGSSDRSRNIAAEFGACVLEPLGTMIFPPRATIPSTRQPATGSFISMLTNASTRRAQRTKRL